jgi:hypothetical protein
MNLGSLARIAGTILAVLWHSTVANVWTQSKDARLSPFEVALAGAQSNSEKGVFVRQKWSEDRIAQAGLDARVFMNCSQTLYVEFAICWKDFEYRKSG